MDKAKIKQLVKELSEITQESIDLNQRYFNTLGFTRNIIWRLNEILKEDDKYFTQKEIVYISNINKK